VPPRAESKSAAPPSPLDGGKDHERSFAIPSFHQKCRPRKVAPGGIAPRPFVGALALPKHKLMQLLFQKGISVKRSTWKYMQRFFLNIAVLKRMRLLGNVHERRFCTKSSLFGNWKKLSRLHQS